MFTKINKYLTKKCQTSAVGTVPTLQHFAKGGRDYGCPDESERILRSMQKREREREREREL